MSQGSRLSGGGIRGGGARESSARLEIRRAAPYSGLRARHFACVFFRSAAEHAFEQVR
jgi:hypothetical protein